MEKKTTTEEIIENLFLPYDLALKFKEKGFRETCVAYFSDGKIALFDGLGLHSPNNRNERSVCCAPTYSQAIQWLMSNRIYVSVELDRTTYPKFAIVVQRYEGDWEFKNLIESQEDWGLYRDYNPAMNRAIEIALSSIKY